ncbi:trichohyalin [Drosophila mojavensis]|uniref:trichohyalin n=1 Tax=Drosophila mojavensis TaxID=7230 RepID=UPI001CD07CED|nr:trichohyalin [Drosophila mojavensis]
MGNAESTSQSAHDSVPAATSTDAPDEPWWQQIEHENLILQQVQEQQLQPVQAMDPSPKTEPTDAAATASAEEVKPEGDGSTLEEFREQLAAKRLARQTAVQEMREELTKLREQLAQEKAENQRLRRQAPSEQVEAAVGGAVVAQESQPDPDDENPSSRSRHANIELANAQLALQLANADNLSLRSELDVVQRQVGTLKEVICCCKQMLSVKEEQCAQLKMKLTEIENSFSEREMKIMSNNLRQEYERQLVNIRQLRQLYEERQRVAAAEYENLQRLISIKKDELIAEQEKTKSCEERNQLLLKELETANDELAKVREECAEHKYEKRALKEQVGAVNLLFSQLVMGFNGKNNLDIDRLTQMLEENRDLLNEMTQAEGSCSDGATLPKLLFELVEQAAKSGEVEPESDKSRSATPTPNTEGEVKAMGEDITDSVKPEPSVKKHRRRSAGGAGGAGVTAAVASLKSHEPEIMGKVATAEEIIGNLPKVWKVLMELLSHHKIERVQFEEQPAAAEDGHKAAPTTATTRAVVGGGVTTTTTATTATTTTAATATGKAAELSVSKTYIKLKDLIMEKKSLVKETNRLKTLNCHLDNRLNEQEKRLSAVSLELTKTWHLVGKMQRQHRQLHTQEQILRYQLQQKRRLLSELKDELEYCRRKWAAARAKNDESQEQCNDWRREFARRKLEDANHSAESGYSDSGPQSDEDTAAAAAAAAGAGPAVVDEASAAAASVAVAVAVAGDAAPRRKHLRDQFEHTRKIKRMQSTSPGRQAAAAAGLEADDEEIVLRWNSAPPTCGWRETETEEDEEEQEMEQEQQQHLQQDVAGTSRGAVARTAHSSRSRQRGKLQATAGNSPHSSPADSGTASRIQKLEQQCQSLIQQVLETSGNRERLEVQLCRFQDEIAPVQHAVPLDEFINRKRLERMTRASSAPATGGGSLTPREEEYTRKRSERLGRLEEESRQLLSRIKRTTDRGHYLKKSLDRIRRAPSREASFESNTEEEPKEEPAAETESPLTAEEQASIARRAARLQRLEHESQQLIAQLSRNTERGEGLANRLDTLHERYDSQDQTQTQSQVQTQSEAETAASLSLTVEQRLEDIERVSANRAERLRRLEQQGDELIARLSNTSERGTAMINRIAQREASRRQEAELLEQTLPVGQQVTSNSSSSTNIVEEASGADCSATVTTTASQLALRQSTGAIPKTPSARSRPQAQLCAAARHEDAHKKRSKADKVETVTETKAETLEDMVLRLRSLPYPTAGQGEEEEKEDEMLEKQEQIGASELKKQECEKQEKLEQTESGLEEKQAEFEKLETQEPEQ